MAINITKGFIHTLFSRVLLLAISVFSSVIVVRALGVESYGIYSYVTLVIGLATILSNLRLGPTNAYFVSSGEGNISELFPLTFYSALGIGLIAAPIVMWIFLINSKVSENIAIITIVLAACGIVFQLMREYMFGFVRGLGWFGKLGVVKFAGAGVRLLMVIILIGFAGKLSLNGLVIIDFLSILLMLLLVFIILPKINLGATFNLELAKKVYVYGGWTFVYMMVLALNGKVDQMLVAYFLNIESLGIYSLAVKFSLLIWPIIESVQIVLLPKIASIDDKTYQLKMVCEIFNVLFNLLIIGYLVSIFLLPYIFILLYGAEFKDGVQPLMILVGGSFIYSLHKVLATYYVAIGEVRMVSNYSIAIFILNIVLSTVLIQMYGMAGAASATAISYLLATMWMLKRFAKENVVSMKSLFVPSKSTMMLVANRLRSNLGFRK